MSQRRPSWKLRAALAADIAFLALVAASASISAQGGVRWHVGTVSLTAKSGTRALMLALAVLVARHVVVPRPSLGARLGNWLREVAAYDGFDRPRLARAIDVGLLALPGALFLVDLSGPARRLAVHLTVTWIAGFLVRLTLFRGQPSLAHSLRARWSTEPWRFDAPNARTLLGAFLLFSIATAILLRQQVLAFTSVPDRGDPLFSMWRIAWIAHQLPVDPRHLFDANIFHPAARTLAYSDAMLLPALIGAPALWLGVPTAVVYTGLLLFSYVAAGLAMFVLVHAVTRHGGAAAIAGLLFAFDTFRLLHYSHLELQFTFCMPLALFFLLRALATGSRSDGALAGLFVALQALCSLYYGTYLAVSLAVFVVCWTFFVRRIDVRAATSLGLAVAVAAALCVPVTIPYWANRHVVGERGADEVRAYSAVGRDYITAYRQSALYGYALWSANDGERKLFPGTVPILLAATALVPPAGPLTAPAIVALAVSVDASLGLHGISYTALYEFLPPFKGFRVPARFRGVETLFLALMAGIGIAHLARRIGNPSVARVTLALVAVLLLVDVHPVLNLLPVWNHAPGIYRLIPDPHAVVADLPLPTSQDPFWRDPVYIYFSTFHWHPLVNGSSGFVPPWYDALAIISRRFPANEALDAYQHLGTEYFVLHERYYGRAFGAVVAAAEAQPRLQFVATDTWEEGECRLYRLWR